MADVLPPLNALRVFAAAAHHGSFTRAAADLHVTQTAVSHQMRLLEEHLGLALFERLPRRLVLTADGRAYAAELNRVFERIRDATANLHARPRREVLAVTSLPSFAARWLVPRLERFSRAQPQIDLRIISTERPLDFSRESVDVGIRFGYGRYAGLRTEKLMDDECFPVCSPVLLRGRRGLRGPADLGHQVLLHDDSPDDWRRWLKAVGASAVDPERGHTFTDANMTLQVAADGQGVAMGRKVLVAGDLASGKLVRPFAGAVPTEQSYFLVMSETTADLPRVKAFRRWLLDEIAVQAEGVAPPRAGRRRGSSGRRPGA